jgi:hypothetical protein
MNTVDFRAGGTASGALGGSGSGGRGGGRGNRGGRGGRGGHGHYRQKVSFFERMDLVYSI